MAARLMALDFQYLEIDGVEFDTYWQNGGYKKISDIIFAEWHIFKVSNLWLYYVQRAETVRLLLFIYCLTRGLPLRTKIFKR
jgi:hypothetical protein